MDRQKHILVIAHSAGSDHTQLINEAQLAAKEGACISLVIVIPAIPAPYFQLPSLNILEQQMMKNGQKQLAGLCKELELPLSRAWVKLGNIRQEVSKLAKEIGATELLTDRTSSTQLENIQMPGMRKLRIASIRPFMRRKPGHEPLHHERL